MNQCIVKPTKLKHETVYLFTINLKVKNIFICYHSLIIESCEKNREFGDTLISRNYKIHKWQLRDT